MSPASDRDPVVLRELPLIRKIQHDEAWLEGERRGYCVSLSDPVVCESVCLIILRIGAQMRAAITAEMGRTVSTERQLMQGRSALGPPVL
jgi:hypothetical protein